MMGFKHLSNSKSYSPFIIPIAILTWAMSSRLHKTVMDFTNLLRRAGRCIGSLYIVY